MPSECSWETPRDDGRALHSDTRGCRKLVKTNFREQGAALSYSSRLSTDLGAEPVITSDQAEQQASIQTTFTLLASTCPVCPYPRALPPAASSLLKPVLNCLRAIMKLSCCQGPAALPSCLRFVGWQYRWYNPSVRCDAHVLPSVASKARGSGLRGKWLLPPNPTEGAKRAKEPIAKAAASVRVQILQVTKQATRLRALLERGVAKAQHAQHRTSSILGYFCLCLRATFRLRARRPPSCGSAREEGAV